MTLTADQCWERLHRSRTGRIAFLDDDAIEMFPVNYIVDGRRIVFATSSRKITDALERRLPVVFEVDEHDGWTAWSVVLRGAMVSADVRESAAQRLRSMLPTHKTAHIVIEPKTVTGRLFDQVAP
ncbi:pyridoxamine 5'-phosphate oxidase family protein [Curtobacterium ammoniigenes]|uniref:pyridoxamine 5'-phosphate oxidase family protein n=1 Tax=Curtobacterium ammoniigenes TaxID=395387 RepID=UPI00146FFFC3|nr:pyridoxamine 5'-phosphate oxidase family protein [Curtobacterium ammoniigenes]